MPQFDSSSFVVQLIWLFIFLIGFYILLCLYFLPSTSQYIKARKALNCKVKVFTYPYLTPLKYNFVCIDRPKKVIF